MEAIEEMITENGKGLHHINSNLTGVWKEMVQKMETMERIIVENEKGLHYIDDNLKEHWNQLRNKPSNNQIIGEIQEMKG
jgi:hypothetical protein